MLHGWATVITVEWTLVSLSLIFVLLRIYVVLTGPTTSSVRSKLSDAIIIIAWLSSATMVALDTVVSKKYLPEEGKFLDVSVGGKIKTPEDAVRALQLIYGISFPWIMTIYLVKASILTWYYSITPPTFSRFRLGLHFICGCCIFSFITSLGMLFLYCQPVSRNWSLDERQLCVASAQPLTFFFTFAWHILTEVLIFVYPFPLLICVRFVPQRQRTWGIIFLFAMGFLAIVATLGKVLAITIHGTHAAIGIGAGVECTTGMIVACCPRLRTLIQSSKPLKLKPSVRFHLKKSSSRTSRTSHTKTQFGSTDTYTSNRVRTAGMTSEIWDGTDSTAPEWIKLESREVMQAMRMSSTTGGFAKGLESGTSGSYVGGENSALRASLEGGGYIYTPPRSYPSFILQPGRGIIQNAPGQFSPSLDGATPWLNMPDPPFLCEKEPGPVEPKRTLSNPSKSNVRWGIEEIDDMGQAKRVKEDDGAVYPVESRDRWDASGRLDRIVETLTEPAAAATKRWSQGSFGDRTNHRRQKAEDEDKKALSKATFFFE